MNFKASIPAALSTILLLMLAGCRNAPPSTAMKSDSPALRAIKSWVAAGAGHYDGRFSGSLDYDNQAMPICGQLHLINAYRFTLALQSVDGRCAFVLRRNWAGAHFLRSPSGSYVALARAIGEGVSLAFRRPEGPWRAAIKGSEPIVAYKDANDNKFHWQLGFGSKHLLVTQLGVKTPSGCHYVVTYIDDAAEGPAGLTISATSPRYLLQLRLTDRNQVTAMAEIP